jgi:hypothetical protein
MRPHEDVPNRDTRGAEAHTDADGSRQDVAPRDSRHHAVARAKGRAEVLSWAIAPAAIDPILDHHPIEQAGNMLWRARQSVADGALAVAGSYARAQ